MSAIESSSQDAIVEAPQDIGGDAIVYAFRREHFDYHCESHDWPPLTEQEFDELPSVISEFHDDFVPEVMSRLRENA